MGGRGAKTPHRDRGRAQIVLAAARGHPNARIAAALGVSMDMVRKWRGRFAARGLDGLKDLPRRGRPRRISALERAAVVALACQLPAVSGVPLARWTGPELLAEITAGLAGSLSLSSVRRILADHPVKPWQYRSWIYPRDPGFEAKAKVILDLYQGFHQGEPLRPGDRILSFDAKPSIQARGRRHPTLPAAPGKPVRVEHEYVRHGALALLAGLDVHTGTVFASTPATTGIKPFMDLAGQVLARPEYKNAPRVFIIVDNGSETPSSSVTGPDVTARGGRNCCGPPGPPPGCSGDVSPAGPTGLRPGWLVQTEIWAGSRAACTTPVRSSRTASRSTASLSRAANAATAWSASYRSRLNRRSTACCTRRRTGLNSAAAASVAAATATGVRTLSTPMASSTSPA